MKINEESCVPCRTYTPPLPQAEAEMLLAKIPGWSLSDDGRRLERKSAFKNFREALAFVNAVGALAEAEKHHPDITLGWGYCSLSLHTHLIGGLHRNDFILAAKITALQ